MKLAEVHNPTVQSQAVPHETKVLLVGLMQSSNLGDMIIAECVKSILEKQGCTVTFLSAEGVANSLRTPDRELDEARILTQKVQRRPSSRFMPEALKAYIAWKHPKHRAIRTKWANVIADSDLVLVGGGQLITNGSVPRVSYIIHTASSHSKPVGLFSVGVQDNISTTARLILRSALKKVSWLSTRSRKSRSALGHLTPGQTCEIVPDPAIFSSSVYPSKCLGAGTAIGFNLQNLSDLEGYLQNLEISHDAFERQLIATIRAVSFAGYSVNLYTNGDPRDQQFAEKVMQRGKLNALGVRLARRPSSTSELVSLIHQNGLNVCFRLHASIISLSLGIPFLVFPWEGKVKDVMQLFDQSSSVVDSTFWAEGAAEKSMRLILSTLNSKPVLDGAFYKIVEDHVKDIVSDAKNARHIVRPHYRIAQW